MKIGLVGRKSGMTRIFTDAGDSIPVTVIELAENRVTQIKTMENDGYDALQVTIGQKKQVKKINKPEGGHYSKAQVGAGCGLWEIRIDPESQKFELGSSIASEVLSEIKYVDVTSTSKGKGFQGVIKRWNFSAQDATHGNSLSHRAPGSIGQNQSPGRVFKGKKMAGQMGNERVTVQNLEVVRIDHEKSLILIKGAVPGSPGTIVHIRPSVKKS